MDLVERMREFINGEVIPAEPDGEAALPHLKAEAKARDLWALAHPEEIGGGGLDLLEFVYLNEIIGRSHLGQFAVGSVSMQDSIMLHRFGTDAQKERWLLPMVAGDIYPSVGFTEPEVAGSDPTLIQTQATVDGDEWVINGHKWFTSGADKAAYTTVFARTESDDTPRHRAMTMIIVPAGTPGMTIVRDIPTMGGTFGTHCEVLFEDCRVPVENTLGDRGHAFAIAQARLGPGRIFHAMRWLGQAQRAYELMLERANTRYAHGSLLAEKGEIRRYVSESAADIQASRLLTLDAARAMIAGDDARVQIGLVKVRGAQMLHDVIDRAIQVHGALGVTGDTPLELMYREARYARIYDGPDEVHRDAVARRILADAQNVPWARRAETTIRT